MPFKLSVTPVGKILLVSIILVAVLYFALHHKTYSNCLQLLQGSHHDILKGDKLYNAVLDRDHDGIACER